MAEASEDMRADESRGASYEDSCVTKHIEIGSIANPLGILQYDLGSQRISSTRARIFFAANPFVRPAGKYCLFIRKAP